MNPCTLMGGFWFEAGRFGFGVFMFIMALLAMWIFVWFCRR